MTDFPYALHLEDEKVEVSFNLRAWQLFLPRFQNDTNTRLHLRRLVKAANTVSSAMAICHFDAERERFVATAQSAHERSIGREAVQGEGTTLAAALRDLATALEQSGRDKDLACMRLVFG